MNARQTTYKANDMRYMSKPCMLLTIGLACLSSPAMSLPGDKDQPIHIQSDKAEQKTVKEGEVTVYSGDVIMEQGSMRLEGNIVTIYSKNRSVNKVISTGKPAYFEQQSETNESPVQAHGDKITYLIGKETIVLLGNASVQQDESTVKGQRFEYHVNTEKIKAKGTQDKSTRVHMVLEPSKQPDTINKDDNGNADSE
jgi:lipopolysaccharide export system protein LptA